MLPDSRQCLVRVPFLGRFEEVSVGSFIHPGWTGCPALWNFFWKALLLIRITQNGPLWN